MRISLRVAAAMLIVGSLAGCVKDDAEAPLAPRSPEPVAPEPVTIPNSELHVLHADAISEEYAIYVGLPPSYSSGERSYPVVYVTDGGGSFPIIVGNLGVLYLGREMPEVIIVGIGNHAESVERLLELRLRDLSPTIDESFAQQSGRRATNPEAEDLALGGADAFLDFLEKGVKPFINERFRTKPDDETLVGYSLGGVFGLHVLLNHTNTFDRYVIGSPSIWWDNEVCFSFEENYANKHNDLAKRVFISAGSLEAGGPTKTVANVEEMVRRLQSRNYPNLKVEHFVFPGETHVSGVGTTFNRGLKSVFNEEPSDSTPLEKDLPNVDAR